MVGIRRVVVACVGAWLFTPGVAHAQDRVGQVIIEGNSDTPDFVILGQLDLRPGQLLDLPSLKATQLRLAKCGLFDPTTPPAVEVLVNELDNTFKDIRIRVKERSGTWMFFTMIDGALGVATLDGDKIFGAAVKVVQRLRGRW